MFRDLQLHNSCTQKSRTKGCLHFCWELYYLLKRSWYTQDIPCSLQANLRSSSSCTTEYAQKFTTAVSQKRIDLQLTLSL